MGTNQFGGFVIALYSPRLGMFSLLDPGIIIDQFFTFDFVGSNTVSAATTWSIRMMSPFRAALT